MFVARSLRDSQGVRYHVGDVVLFGNGLELGAGELWYNLAMDGQLVSCISVWECVSEPADRRSRTYRVQDRPVLVPIANLRAVAPVRVLNGEALVLLPLHCRL